MGDTIRYKRSHSLGKGSYGEIYEATDTTNGRTVAIKTNTVPLEHKGYMNNILELDMMSKMSVHPFCVTLERVIDGDPFSKVRTKHEKKMNKSSKEVYDSLSYQLSRGDMNARKFFKIAEHGNFANIQTYLVQILLGTEYIHARNVVHRDFKPDNIICMTTKSVLDEIQIIDFGMSVQAYSLPNFEHEIVTVPYRAPEIFLQRKYGYKSDLWAIGCMAYEAIVRDFLFRQAEHISVDNDGDTLYTLFEKVYTTPSDIYFAKLIYKTLKDENPKFKENCITNKIRKMREFKKFPGDTGDQFCDLIKGLLIFDPLNRMSATDALNSSFFDSSRKLIQKTRYDFGINDKGILVQPLPTFDFSDTDIRRKCMAIFVEIYNERDEAYVSQWYSNRIMFLGIALCDRFLLGMTGPPDDLTEKEFVHHIVSACLHLVTTYCIYEVDMFSMGVDDEDERDYIDEHNLFEKNMLLNIFDCNVYTRTLYEAHTEILSEKQTWHLLKLVMEGTQLQGYTNDTIASAIDEKLTTINTGTLQKMVHVKKFKVKRR